MDYKKYYEENKSSLIKTLHDVGYTPHQLAEEAYKEGVSIYEYVYLLNNL